MLNMHRRTLMNRVTNFLLCTALLVPVSAGWVVSSHADEPFEVQDTLELNQIFITPSMIDDDAQGVVRGILYQPKADSTAMRLYAFVEWKEVADVHPVDIIIFDGNDVEVERREILVANSGFYHVFPFRVDLTKSAPGTWTLEAREQGRVIGKYEAEVVTRYEDLSFYDSGMPMLRFDPPFYSIETDLTISTHYRYEVSIDESGKVSDVQLTMPTGYAFLDEMIIESARKHQFVPMPGAEQRSYWYAGRLDITQVDPD